MLDPGDDSHEGIAVVEQRIADAARPKTPAMPTQQPTTNPDEEPVLGPVAGCQTKGRQKGPGFASRRV